MDVTVICGALADELAGLMRVVARKETIPALQYVRASANGSSALALAATDLDVGLVTSCETDTVKGDGTELLPASRLYELARLLPADATMRIRAQGGTATIEAGEYKGTLKTLAAEEFPTLAEPPAGALALPPAPLRAMIGQVKASISGHDQRYTTDGARLLIDDGVLTLVTTDGHRLSVATYPCEGDLIDEIVPRKTLLELEALLDQAEAVTFAATENHLFFATPRRRLISKRLDGKFPAHDRVLAGAQGDKVLTVGSDALAMAVRRVALVTEATSTRAVRLAFRADGLRLSAAGASVGEAGERVPADYAGADVDAGMQSGYVLDVATAAAGARLELRASDADRPVLFTSLAEGPATYRCVIMPVRL